jgi:hypothetical protein
LFGHLLLKAKSFEKDTCLFSKTDLTSSKTRSGQAFPVSAGRNK